MRAPTPAAIAPSWRTPATVIASHQPLCFIVFSMTSLAIILSQIQHAASTGIFLFDGTETRYSRIQNNRPKWQSRRADGLLGCQTTHRHCEEPWRRSNPAQFSKAHVRIPAARFARVAHEACPSKTEGAGKAGCFAHPQPRVQSRKAHELVTTGPPKHSGFSCANGFNGFLRALSGDRLFLSPSPVRCASIVTRLNASVEASKPHDFAVRSLAHSSRAPTTSTGSRIHVRDDRDTPLL